MLLRHYLPKLRLNWSGSKSADRCSSSVSFCKQRTCAPCHGVVRRIFVLHPPSVTTVLDRTQSTTHRTVWACRGPVALAIYASENPLRMAALALCASWRCAPPQCLAALFFVGHRQGSHGVVGCAATARPPARGARGQGAAGRTLACLYVARRSVTPRWGSVSSSPPRSAPGRPWTWRQTGTKPRWVGRRS